MSDFGQFLLICCFIPTLVLLVIGFVIVRNFARFLGTLTPSHEELHQQFEAMRAGSPNATQQQLVRKIINQQAIRQGIIGALTSVGGFFTLPFGLTIDLLYSTRSNTALSYFIAKVYGIKSDGKTLNFGQLLVLRQGTVSPDDLIMWQERFSGVVSQQLTRMILRKSFAKLIPGAGAIIGFIVNWSSAQFFGRVADAYYARNQQELT